MKSLKQILLSSLFISHSLTGWSQEQPQQQTQTQTTTTTTTTEQKVSNEAASQPQTSEDSNTKKTGSGSEWMGFHAGIIGQATFTNVKISSENSTISTSYVVGYGGGGFIGYFFNQNAEVRVEALYSSLAQEITENGAKTTLNLSYINFPLLLGLHTAYNKPVSFNVMVGPQIGINTSSSLDGEGQSGIDTVQASISIKPADIGIAYGAGLDFGLGVERLLHLNIGFRGVYGLIDISDDSNNTTTSSYYILDRAKLKTYSGYAGISYKF